MSEAVYDWGMDGLDTALSDAADGMLPDRRVCHVQR